MFIEMSIMYVLCTNIFIYLFYRCWTKDSYSVYEDFQCQPFWLSLIIIRDCYQKQKKISKNLPIKTYFSGPKIQEKIVREKFGCVLFNCINKRKKMQSHHKVVVTPGDAGLSTVSTSSSDKWKCEVRISLTLILN